MSRLLAREASVSGDAPANHAGETGSIPVSRSNTFQTFDDLTVEPLSLDVAREVITQNHYSKKWNDVHFGRENFAIRRHGELLGVAVYGHPMNPASWDAITKIDANKCLELNRLWLDDRLVTNSETWFVTRTMRMLRDSGYRLIQSFADGRLGVGTIYQAANFGYYGFHTSIFHEHVETGEVFHDVPFANTRFPKTMLSRNMMHVDGVLKTFEVKTYRYLMPLDRGSRRSILLSSEPYPKVRDGLVPRNDYVAPMGQMSRSAAIAQKMWRSKDFDALRSYLLARDSRADDLIEQESENEWIVKMHADTPLFEF